MSNRARLKVSVLLTQIICVFTIACATGRSQELREIAENVRVNEELYDNLEVYMRLDYRLVQTPTNEQLENQPSLMETMHADWRFVLQGDKIFVNAKGFQSSISGPTRQVSDLLGYDGNMTRSVSNGNVVNLRSERFEPPDVKRGHMLMFDSWFLGYRTLGALLVATKVVDSESDIVWQVRGEETIDGLRCCHLKLDLCKQEAGKAVAFNTNEVWLAIERNYFPVKIRGWRLFNDKMQKLPGAEYHTKQFIQLSPGIWYPAQVASTTYDVLKIDSGVHEVFHTQTYSMEKVSLNPQYGIELFRDIPIPPGAAVYEVSNGNITKSYQAPAAAIAVSTAGQGRLWITLWIACGCAVLTAGVFLWRRRQAALAHVS